MINPAKFLREVRVEAARTTWPSRKETTASTITVLVLVAVAAVFFLCVDYAISNGVSLILGIGR